MEGTKSRTMKANNLYDLLEIAIKVKKQNISEDIVVAVSTSKEARQQIYSDIIACTGETPTYVNVSSEKYFYIIRLLGIKLMFGDL